MQRVLCCLFILLLLCSAGCDILGTSGDSPQPLCVGLLTDGDSVEDGGINQEIWNSLQQLKSEILGLEIQYRVPGQDGGYSECAAFLAERGCTLIICADGSMADTIVKVAQENPRCTFAVMDCADLEQDNVVCLGYAMEDAVYLAGYTAGKISTSERLGCVHGRLTGETERLLVSFMAGAKAANSDILLLRKNIVTQRDQGRQATEELVANGADIVFHVDGTEDSAVLQGCRANGIRAVSVNAKQGSKYRDTVLAFAQKEINAVVRRLVSEAMERTLKVGSQTLDFSNGGISLTVNGDLVSEKIAASINNARDRIAAGEITIPTTFESLYEKYPELADNLSEKR